MHQGPPYADAPFYEYVEDPEAINVDLDDVTRKFSQLRLYFDPNPGTEEDFCYVSPWVTPGLSADIVGIAIQKRNDKPPRVPTANHQYDIEKYQSKINERAPWLVTHPQYNVDPLALYREEKRKNIEQDCADDIIDDLEFFNDYLYQADMGRMIQIKDNKIAKIPTNIWKQMFNGDIGSAADELHRSTKIEEITPDRYRHTPWAFYRFLALAIKYGYTELVIDYLTQKKLFSRLLLTRLKGILLCEEARKGNFIFLRHYLRAEDRNLSKVKKIRALVYAATPEIAYLMQQSLSREQDLNWDIIREEAIYKAVLYANIPMIKFWVTFSEDARGEYLGYALKFAAGTDQVKLMRKILGLENESCVISCSSFVGALQAALKLRCLNAFTFLYCQDRAFICRMLVQTDEVISMSIHDKIFLLKNELDFSEEIKVEWLLSLFCYLGAPSLFGNIATVNKETTNDILRCVSDVAQREIVSFSEFNRQKVLRVAISTRNPSLIEHILKNIKMAHDVGSVAQLPIKGGEKKLVDTIMMDPMKLEFKPVVKLILDLYGKSFSVDAKMEILMGLAKRCILGTQRFNEDLSLFKYFMQHCGGNLSKNKKGQLLGYVACRNNIVIVGYLLSRDRRESEENRIPIFYIEQTLKKIIPTNFFATINLFLFYGNKLSIHVIEEVVDKLEELANIGRTYAGIEKWKKLLRRKQREEYLLRHDEMICTQTLRISCARSSRADEKTTLLSVPPSSSYSSINANFSACASDGKSLRKPLLSRSQGPIYPSSNRQSKKTKCFCC